MLCLGAILGGWHVWTHFACHVRASRFGVQKQKTVCAIWGLCCSVIFQSLVFRLGFSSLHVWKPKTACLDELDFGVQPSSADPRFHRELSPSILHDNWQCGPGTIHVPCAEHFGTETDGSL